MGRSTLSRLCAVAAGLAAVTVTMAGMTASGAQAATIHRSTQVTASSHSALARLSAAGTFTIPAGTRSRTFGSRGAHITVIKSATRTPQTINCTVDPETPAVYSGEPYGGGEYGVAEVDCSAVVYEIEVEVALFRNGVQVTYNSNTEYETTEASAVTDYPLSPGDYATAAEGIITATYGGSATTSPVYESNTVYLS